MESAGGIKNYHINVLLPGRGNGTLGNINRVLIGTAREELDTHFASEGFQLANRRRTVDVGADHQDGFFLPLFKEAREFGDRGRLTCTLQTRHHDYGRRLDVQIEGFITLAHDAFQLLLDNFHKDLARRQTALHLLANGTLADALNKVLHHRQGDIRLQQRHAHFPQGVLYIVISEARLAGNLAQTAGKSVLEVLKHVALPYPG